MTSFIFETTWTYINVTSFKNRLIQPQHSGTPL